MNTSLIGNPSNENFLSADSNSPETKAKEQEQNKIKSQISSAINGTYNQCLVKNNLN